MSAKQKNIKDKVTSNNVQEAKSRRRNKSHGNSLPKWSPYAIIFVTAIIYLKALQNGFTNIDDDYYIVNNPYLRDFSLNGIVAIFTHFYSFNYHPFTSLTNLIEYKLFGLNPLPYHFVNVCLHLLNIWLVYVLAQLLSSKRSTALIVCILFAIHPLHVESVAWVAERKDVLYTFFYFSSLITYLLVQLLILM